LRSKRRTIPLLFLVLVLLSASGCTHKHSAEPSAQSIQQKKTQNDAAASNNTSAQNVLVSPFEGTVDVGKPPLIKIPNKAWEQAKKAFESENPSLKGTMKSVKSTDFTLTDNWQGILKSKPFLLNIYSYQARLLLAVSEYGNQPVKVKILISGPKGAFAFYGDSVWLMQEVKGVGISLNIMTDEVEGFSPSAERLNLEFDRLFTELSAAEPEKRTAGSRMQIDGNDLLVVHDMVVAVIQ